MAPANACVKLPDDAPLDKAALIGCSVMTGVGAVFNTAAVRPGSSVAVFGAGGVGLNVIQGAVIAGAERIIAVDVSDGSWSWRRTFGATDGHPSETVAAIAIDRRARSRLRVRGHRSEGVRSSRRTRRCVRAGTCVVIGIGSRKESVSLNVFFIPITEKRWSAAGTAARTCTATRRDCCRSTAQGKLKLDELLTRTYRLQEVNQAFADMDAGVNARGLVVF